MLTLLRPRFWGIHLAGVLAVAAAIALGLWQYGAWQQHRSAEQRDLTSARPVALASVMTGDSPFPGQDLGRPVRFTGTWMGEDTLFVADRHLGDRTGYWVVTPVRVGASAMPVVRGWAAKPQAPDVHGRASVTGWLQASEGSGLIDDNPADRVIPEMRIASIVQLVDADLYSGYVVARTHEAGLGAVTPRDIPKVSATTALRNLLYALQWWFFAGFAVYMWWRWCQDALAGPSETTQEASVASDA